MISMSPIDFESRCLALGATNPKEIAALCDISTRTAKKWLSGAEPVRPHAVATIERLERELA